LNDATPDVATLDLNRTVTGNIENFYSTDLWRFSAAAGQQVKFHLVKSLSPATVFSLTGPGGFIGFTRIAGDSPLVSLPSDGQYTLTAQGNGGISGAYAFQLLETTQSPLALGGVYNGKLTGSGHAHLLCIMVPYGKPMLVTLDDSSTANRNELYAKLGSPPTREDFDFRSPATPAADQKLLVPMAAPGDWYVLVYGDYVPSPTNYTLSAVAGNLIISSMTPDHAGNAADSVLTISGAGFDSTTTVALVSAGGTTYPAQGTSVDSFTQLSATFAAGDVPAGTYTVRLTQSDGDSAQRSNAFTVTAGGVSNLSTHITVPQTLGRHAVATLYLDYANTGTVAMPAPLLTVHGDDGALLTLDKSRVIAGFWTSAKPAGFDDAVQILASGATPGVLQPGESIRVPIYYAGLLKPWDFDDTKIDFEVDTLQAGDSTSTDWSPFKEQLRPRSLAPDAWDPIWANFIAQVGNTGGSFVSMLDDNASYLGHLGRNVNDVNALLAFEMQQAAGLRPISTLADTVDAAVDAPGLPLTFGRSFGIDIAQHYALSTLGRGWSHNWQYQLTADSDGTVTIAGPGGSLRVFQPDSRSGKYFAHSEKRTACLLAFARMANSIPTRT
jgi:hypothetical protein